MKKNIFLGLILLNVVPVFASYDGGENGTVAQSRGIRAILWSWVPAKRYVANQTVYGVAGGCGAYTAAHCAGASDGWLRWIGLGGLCGGLWLGGRTYRSLDRETGALEQRAATAEEQAAVRQTAVNRLNIENGRLQGQREAAQQLADQRQVTINIQNETIVGLREDVASARGAQALAEGEFKEAVDGIKKNTGLHAIAFLGVAYTKNETDKLLLKAPYIGEKERSEQVEILNRQQHAFRSTASFMMRTQPEISAETLAMLPEAFMLAERAFPVVSASAQE